MTRLALFDLDDTIIDRRTALTTAVAGLCADFGYGHAVEAWMLRELADHANPEDLARLREAFDFGEPLDELWERWVGRMAAAVTCRSTVLDGLAGLRAAGWAVGIITNGASDIQRAKIDTAGLDGVIDGIAVSGDIDARKPDPKLFELAAQRCRGDLAGATMTGDSPAADVGGGHAAGLRTIWLRGRPWPAGVPAPHHTVDDVEDAIDILLTAGQE